MLIRRILYWSNYTVIRWQLLLFLLAVLLVRYMLHSEFKMDDNRYWPAMELYLTIIFWSLITLVGISLVTVLLAWGFYFFSVKGQSNLFEVSFGDGEKTEAGLVPVKVKMKSVVRPLFGSVRARLVFSEMKISKAFALDENTYEKGSLIRKGIEGTGQAMLHDRGIYDLEEVQFFFCDMFRLVSLPITAQTAKQFFTLPHQQNENQVKANPNTTENQTHRIEIPKRVEGEFLNYKDFESGDDVRRIVWKIYARSGQLVVRIPETMDPYASHLYFYASFYNSMDTKGDLFETELLNSYKDRVRNIFEALAKNGFDMRLPHDQETPKLQGMGDKKNELFHIAAANWQTNQAPLEFVQVKKAAFVCVSSLTPAAEINRLLGNLPQHVPVACVRMSEGIRSPFKIKIKTIFFQPERSPEDKLRQPWLLSPLRSRLKNNEREILNTFQRRGNAWLISPEGKL